MFREEYWTKGIFVDNHQKYECYDCGKQFIIGEEMSKGCDQGFPVCPYCGQNNVEMTVYTSDDELRELYDEIGCLALHVKENDDE